MIMHSHFVAYCGQRGGMSILFAGFIVPLSLLLVSAAIEVQTYTATARGAQEIADNAALFASRYLPDTQAAQSAGRAFIHAQLPSSVVEAGSTTDSVSFTVLGSYEPIIGSYFEILTGNKLRVPYNASSISRSNPFDVYVAIDRSAYLSPSLYAEEVDAWGESGRWGSADIFDEFTIESNGEVVHPRIATQQCFNPIFAPIKQSAIRILDYLSSFHLNRVAISFFPGATRPVGQTRHLKNGDQTTEHISFYDTHVDWDNDHYVTIEERESSSLFPVQSINCAAAAEREQYYVDYRVPVSPRIISQNEYAGYLINTGDWSINEQYPLTTREVIWSRAVNKNGVMDFTEVLIDLEYSLFGSGSLESRGGMKNRSTEAAFIITNRLPFASGYRFEHIGDHASALIDEQLARIRSLKRVENSKLTVYYLLIGGQAEEASALQEFFSLKKEVSESGQELFEIRVVRGVDPEVTVSGIISALLLENKSHAVAQ